METTIFSYLTARPARDTLIATRQRVTREWWVSQRHRFSLFVSETVLSEAEAGDSDAAGRRLTQLAGLPVLKTSADAQRLVKRFIGAGGISPSFVEDAFHVAIAMVNAIDYLLTWNCRHIANAEIAARLKIVATEEGYTLPLLEISSKWPEWMKATRQA